MQMVRGYASSGSGESFVCESPAHAYWNPPHHPSPQLAWISPTPDPDSISKSGVEGIEGEFCLNRVVIASYLFYDPLRVGDDDDDDDDALMRSVLRLSRLLSRLGHGTVTCSVGLERPVVL